MKCSNLYILLKITSSLITLLLTALVTIILKTLKCSGIWFVYPRDDYIRTDVVKFSWLSVWGVSQRGQYHGTRRKLIFLFIMWKTVIITLYVYTQGRAYSTENRRPLERKSSFKRSSISKCGIGRPQIRCTNDQVKAAGLRWTQAICNRGLCGGLWTALDVLLVTRRWWW